MHLRGLARVSANFIHANDAFARLCWGEASVGCLPRSYHDFIGQNLQNHTHEDPPKTNHPPPLSLLPFPHLCFLSMWGSFPDSHFWPLTLTLFSLLVLFAISLSSSLSLFLPPTPPFPPLWPFFYLTFFSISCLSLINLGYFGRWMPLSTFSAQPISAALLSVTSLPHSLHTLPLARAAPLYPRHTIPFRKVEWVRQVDSLQEFKSLLIYCHQQHV